MRTVGYGELVEKFGLTVTRPDSAAFLVEQGHRQTRSHDGFTEERYPLRYAPGPAWTDHLTFALKHEGVNLEILAALFSRAPEAELATWIASSPTGRYTRLAWFFFEWLTGRRLDLPSLTQGNYLHVLDPGAYYTAPPAKGAPRARRQRLINNLPGTPTYCPLVRRTKALEAHIAGRLEQKIRERLAEFPEMLIRRAAQYLYLKETKSSYAIESLRPDTRRTTRFVELLHRSGGADCFSEAALVGLQNAIVDGRYAAKSFRNFQNFIGQSLGPGRELVHYAPPRPEDLPGMMAGWTECCRNMLAGGMPPVAAAAVAGFGFVFLHPFEDGNGRIHRFLIHHVLAATGFSPPGIIFPVSAQMLRERPRYDEMLEHHSRRIMEHVEWRFTPGGELVVENDTASLYRYPDMTLLAERMFGMVRETLLFEFGAELEYLAAFDEAREEMRGVVDMPDARMDLFIRLCLQGKGLLSRAKRGIFSELSDGECARMEEIVGGAMRRARESQEDDGPWPPPAAD